MEKTASETCNEWTTQMSAFLDAKPYRENVMHLAHQIFSSKQLEDSSVLTSGLVEVNAQLSSNSLISPFQTEWHIIHSSHSTLLTGRSAG